MKAPYSWLKDFVDITLAPDELAERLTMAGLTVEGIEDAAGDKVFVIEVTSNRPDWLSIRGIAREVAAITGKHLKKVPAPAVEAGVEKVEVRIEDAKDCPLYTARIVRGVKAGESPEWIRRRLEQVGVRPVNNIVDITNYVLFELGEPLHAFDLDKLAPGPTPGASGSAGACPCIVTRRARKGEKLVAIDGKEYTLDPGILVIADSKGPVAIAGVMGGKQTEVSFSTKNVLLEAAIFDPVLIRRGRQLLGLQSEASYRFERGIDPCAPGEASARSCGLMAEIAGGKVAGAGSSGAAPRGKPVISLDPSKACAYLGIDIGAEEIAGILSSLGFEVKKEAGLFAVGVPSFRVDVEAPVDLIEEVARVHGYGRIPVSMPPMVMQPQRSSPFIPAIKETLIAQGFTEVLTFSLTDRRLVEGFYAGRDIAEVANPLSNEQEIMRPSILPSLAKVLAYNLNQRQPSAAVFEVAKTYGAPDVEKNVLGLGACGTFTRWLGPRAGNVQYKAGFLLLKGAIDGLLSRLRAGEAAYAYSGADTVTVNAQGKEIGLLRRITGKDHDPFDIKDKELYCAEISLDLLLPMARAERSFTAFSRFPSISRDITLELDAGIPLGKVLEAARRAGKGLMKVSFLDYFDKNLPEGTKRLTITCVYSAPDRTLTESEIAPVHAGVVDALKKEFSAQVR